MKDIPFHGSPFLRPSAPQVETPLGVIPVMRKDTVRQILLFVEVSANVVIALSLLAVAVKFIFYYL